jgi:hypothetical protein
MSTPCLPTILFSRRESRADPRGSIRREQMHVAIRIKGHLDPSWQPWLGGLQIEHEEAGTTLLSGPLPDQAALQGVLLQIIRLGLTLLSLETSGASPQQEAGERS